MSARVSWISFAPIKGTALHSVDEAELREGGVAGDRRFYLVGEGGRLFNDEDCAALQLVRAEYDEPSNALTLRFEDGRVLSAPVEHGEEIETTFHKRPRRARLVLGPFSDAISELADQPVRLVEPEHPATDRGRGGAVTLLSTGSLAAMASVLDVDSVDPRRFRMTFGVDGVEPHAEDSWRGRRVRIGSAVVVPQGNVGRCVVTKLNPATAEIDLDTLNALAEYRRDVETTEPLPFGVHAAVAETGHVRVGDPVELL